MTEKMLSDMEIFELQQELMMLDALQANGEDHSERIQELREILGGLVLYRG